LTFAPGREQRDRDMTTKVLLVAEDDENDVLILERALRRAAARFRLVHVPDGEQAVDYISGRGVYSDRARHPVPDLVLLDLRMPRMDGFEVLRWRRGSDTMQRLPVIVFSTSALERDVHQAYSLGANSYVVKPMGTDALEDLLRALHQGWARFNVTGASSSF
jgi:CheY-like chemotaxis protein